MLRLRATLRPAGTARKGASRRVEGWCPPPRTSWCAPLPGRTRREIVKKRLMATVIATEGRLRPARSTRGESARLLRLVDGDRPERRSAPAPGEMVPRPGLVERLFETAAIPLVLVVAPAGYGKTTLLADWSRA